MNETLERYGKVLSVDCDGWSQVRLEGASACNQCISRGGCASASMKDHVVNLRLPGSPQGGECGTVAAWAPWVVAAACLGYVFPVMCLLMGAVVAGMHFGSDEASVAGAAVGLLAGLLGVRLMAGRVLRGDLSSRAPSRYDAPLFPP